MENELNSGTIFKDSESEKQIGKKKRKVKINQKIRKNRYKFGTIFNESAF